MKCILMLLSVRFYRTSLPVNKLNMTIRKSYSVRMPIFEVSPVDEITLDGKM